MKDYLKRKLITWFIIIAVFFIGASAFIIIKYSQNPTGFESELEQWRAKALEMSNDLYGNSAVKDNIVLPEKELLTEAQNYYFYQQLSETGKKIYVTIENSVDKMLEGEDNIPLPASLNDVAKKDGKEKVAKEFQNAWDAFITDKSEYFYLDSSKVCLITKITTRGSLTEYEFAIGKGDNKTYLIDEFNSKDEVEKAIKQIDSETEYVLKNVSGNNYQKMLYIHDWIVDNTKYETEKTAHTTNIYGCIVKERAICEGYARTFKYFMDKLDIPCILVSGDVVDENGKSERHAWNYVYINNNWYSVDTTWDDPIIIGNGAITEKIKYKYFLKGSETMNKDHTTFGQITEDGMEFEYPELATDDLV